MSAHESPMDAFEVGQYVIQIEPMSYGKREAGFGSLFGGTATLVESFDRSYMTAPYLVVSVDMPLIVIENVRAEYDGKKRRSIVDTRRWKMRILTKEFVDAFLGTERAP